MQIQRNNTKSILIAVGVIAVLVSAYVVSQLVTANGQQRAKSMSDVPGGQRVDPNGLVDQDRPITFHAWADPDDGQRYILAQGRVTPNTLERLASTARYTVRYGGAFDPARNEQRITGWYAEHGVNARSWPTGFGADGCYVYGKTTVGEPFRMVFDRKTGRFVMRYELR